MDDRLIFQLHTECLGLSRAERAARIAAFAEMHRRAPSTVRKQLSRLRAARQGPRPVRVTPTLARAAEVVSRYRHTPDGLLTVEQAQLLALREGALAAQHPVSSLTQAIARLGLAPQAGYVRRMEAPHANHTHRVDVSGSRHFQVVAQEGGDWVLRVVRAEQRNKRWKENELLWMVVVIDDYSRVVAARYVVAPGESAEMVQRVLVNHAWRGSDLRGMPSVMLICDQGAFGKHQSTRSLLDHFGITLEMGQPENSQRNGRVERAIRTVKESFERTYLGTHGLGAICRLSALQEELNVFTRKVNEGRHPVRRDLTRLEDWARSMQFHEIRECPEDALHQAVYREQRTVSAEGWVQLGNEYWEIAGLPSGLRGRKITIVFNRAGERVAEHDGSHYPLRAATPVTLGTYDSPAAAGRTAPPAQRIAKEAAERPRSGVSLYAKDAAVRPAPTRRRPASRMAPADTGADDKVVRITPRSAPAARRPDPFAGNLSRFRDTAEAMDAVRQVIGRPWHAVIPDEVTRQRIVKDLEAKIASFGLDRRRVHDLACELKTLIG